MKLTELEPEWVYDFNPETHGLRRADDSRAVVHNSEGETAAHTLTITNAQGVMFLCPACFVKNGGAKGTESVLCWFKDRGVPADALPGPGRWTAAGTSFEDLTLSPSVNVDNEHWHGWVQNGEVR
jgi:hypothetical protein